MYYTALWKMPWEVYIQAMQDGIKEHKPLRSGLYAQKGVII